MADHEPGLDASLADAGSIAGNALGDQPTSVDSLGFTPYVEAIARYLTSEATRPPLTISIEGDWGSGKSSFLLQLERAIGGARVRTPLSARAPRWLGGLGAVAGAARQTSALSVRFNAWRHDKQDALWAAFALAFVKSLRSEVGLIRAWRGDLQLFLKRLRGPRAWLELGLLTASLLAVVVGVGVAWSLVTTHAAEVKQLLDWLVKVESKPKEGEGAVDGAGATALHLIASTGTFGTMAALGLAGLLKFGSFIKMPLSVKLEKYISKPDYEGHVSFIEDFHVDLNRLVEAYAGDRRVFIFIDDLDRCDVPRAADLMQAINLMIGDARNLIFVIGMDREKVAAGIAQKYKDILPFLRDSAHWKPNDEKDNYTPLYFGYGYLEKFIQISFSLPLAADQAALESFFREDRAPAQSSWGSRLYSFWADWFRRVRDGGAIGPTGEAGSPPPSEPPPAAAPEERTYNRVKVERESERIRKIVRSVSAVFEYNPRRIKQFINTFRLSLYIASDLGLFDKAGRRGPDATPEQIGKFVALLLRFPDLRFALEQDSTLLGKLQDAALVAPDQRLGAYHWLDKPGTVELLAFGCGPGAASTDYSLTRFDISRLMSVLPRAARPPEVSTVGIAVFEELADRYEAIRATEVGSPARTRKLSRLAGDAQAQAQGLTDPAQMLALLASRDRPGARLMRIQIASAHKDAANLGWLLDFNRNFASPFEHYWCIRTLIDYAPLMTEAQRARVNADLTERWKMIASDPGRVSFASSLRELTTLSQPTAATPTAAARPKAASSKVLTSRVPAKRAPASKAPAKKASAPPSGPKRKK